jgi:hypothetical protein
MVVKLLDSLFEKYLGYSTIQTKKDLAEDDLSSLKRRLKTIDKNINELQKELIATKGVAPVYGIKEQIENLEKNRERVELAISRKESETMEATMLMFESLFDSLQAKVDEGRLPVDRANEVLEFAKEDYDSDLYEEDMIRIESVVEDTISFLGITDLTAFESADEDQIFNLLRLEAVSALSDGKISKERCDMLLEYLNPENYDAEGIFVEKDKDDCDDDKCPIKKLEHRITSLKMQLAKEKDEKEKLRLSDEISDAFENLKDMKEKKKKEALKKESVLEEAGNEWKDQLKNEGNLLKQHVIKINNLRSGNNELALNQTIRAARETIGKMEQIVGGVQKDPSVWSITKTMLSRAKIDIAGDAERCMAEAKKLRGGDIYSTASQRLLQLAERKVDQMEAQGGAAKQQATAQVQQQQ